jgi:hypothetical protein
MENRWKIAGKSGQIVQRVYTCVESDRRKQSYLCISNKQKVRENKRRLKHTLNQTLERKRTNMKCTPKMKYTRKWRKE